MSFLKIVMKNTSSNRALSIINVNYNTLLLKVKHSYLIFCIFQKKSNYG